MIKVCGCRECGTLYEGFDKRCPNCGDTVWGEIILTEEEYQEEFGDKDVN